MRKAILLFSLVSITLAIAADLSPASALKQQTTSFGTVSQVCGGSAQSGNGHYGCSKPCGKTMCDYDCKMSPSYSAIKCTKTTIIKPTGGSKIGRGSIRTGGVKGISGAGTGKPTRHPVRVGTGVHPTNPPNTAKTDQTVTQKHGDMNQAGGHHR